MNKDTNTVYQNVWVAIRAVLRRKFRALTPTLEKKKRSQWNNHRFII